jgi:hypothetical protein
VLSNTKEKNLGVLYVQGNTQGWQHYQKEDPGKEIAYWAKFSNALVQGLHPMQTCYKLLFFFIQPRSAENEKTSSQYFAMEQKNLFQEQNIPLL